MQWGAWGGAGMALRVPGFLERSARRGLGVLRPDAGLAALSHALRSAGGHRVRARPVLVGAASLKRVRELLTSCCFSCFITPIPWVPSHVPGLRIA